MNALNTKIRESWDDFQKRVIALEKNQQRPIFRGWVETGIILSVIGLAIIIFYNFAVHLFLIYFVGALFLGCGIGLIIIKSLLVFASSSEINTRLRLIKDRGDYAKCIYLNGSLPNEKNHSQGFCNLYNKNLIDLPYCIYCKNYTKADK